MAEWKTFKIPLAFPIVDASGPEPRTVSEIAVAEPNLDQLEQIEALEIVGGERPTMKQIRGLIIAFSGLPSDVVGKLHRKDVTTVGNAIVPLLSD